ncbi:glycoside hydrolase family 10 protein [Aeoliella mucimassa]|uniref:Glycosyl hydrolase-like 10 domain-containing protein n=1 Tax=Aeoliella mucimassa TaxID=2527972 RepID=A0A518AS77_9BACT|nr:family 10 glycosylhydrolase [Aeoliella mucimassa]QDU57575.1 hypothetical protein Pan181_37930 [Aeoliella mucimassa]
MKSRLAILLLVLCSIPGLCLAGSPPPVAREFRAAWIATVANIDWPSKPGLSPETQRKELIELLDLARDLKMNAVVFQVRPACDALYESQLEPWSEFLTGTAGTAPEDGYDPLEFAVTEAHARGLELHAWFNPFRASHPSGSSKLAADHISKTQPDIVKQYGKYLWLDPGEPAAIDHSCKVVLDVVQRYDIDAVHFDDYFYPYPITDDEGKEISFPDEESWAKYQTSTPARKQLTRDDWRRQNVNHLLERLAKEIKAAKPWVRFGISPFGIYRPGQPESIRGFDAYDKLYADSQKWLVDGTVDYMSPQLYWPIEQKAQSFPVLLEWWQQQNPHERHIWPGLFTSKVLANGEGWPTSEIEQQIELVRKQSTAAGHIHFSIKAIKENRSGLKDLLASQVYTEPCIPPATTWCDAPDSAVNKPHVVVKNQTEGTSLTMSVDQGNVPWLWLVQVETDGTWITKVVPGSAATCVLEQELTSANSIVVSPVDRLNRIGKPVPKSAIEYR